MRELEKQKNGPFCLRCSGKLVVKRGCKTTGRRTAGQESVRTLMVFVSDVTWDTYESAPLWQEKTLSMGS